MKQQDTWRILQGGLLLLGCLGMLVAAHAQGAGQPHPTESGAHFRLTILHHNDGESQLLNAGGKLTDFGGVARFAALVQKLKREAMQGDDGRKGGVIMLSSGDNFLAGPVFTVSVQKGVPFYDSQAMELTSIPSAGRPSPLWACPTNRHSLRMSSNNLADA
jgi:5'-nucleotidase